MRRPSAITGAGWLRPSGASCRSSARYPDAGTDTRAGPCPRLSCHPGADIGALGVARAGPLSVPSARNLARVSVSVSCQGMQRACPCRALASGGCSPCHRRAGPCLPCRAIGARGYRPALPCPALPCRAGPRECRHGPPDIGAGIGARECHARGSGPSARVRASGSGPSAGVARGSGPSWRRGYCDQRLCHPRSEFRRSDSRIYVRVLRFVSFESRIVVDRSGTGRSRVLIIQILQNHNPNSAKFRSLRARIAIVATAGVVSIAAVPQNNNPNFVFVVALAWLHDLSCVHQRHYNSL